MIPLSIVRVDSIGTDYPAYVSGPPPAKSPPKYSGMEVQEILRNITYLALENKVVRWRLETAAGFAIDEVLDLLTPEEHQHAMKYYSILYQSSELPALQFTSASVNAVVDNGTNKVKVALQCPGKQYLNGMKCIHNNEPCTYNTPLSESTFTKVNISKYGGGFENNIALNSVVVFYHILMGKIFSTTNWTESISKLGIYEGFYKKNYSDNRISLSANEMKNFGVDITEIEQSTSLSITSCITSELIISKHFMFNYTAKLIEDILVEKNLYIKRQHFQEPAIPQLKLYTSKVLEYPVHITTGAWGKAHALRSSNLWRINLTKTARSEGQVKKNRNLLPNMVYGSSFRHIQYLAFYPRYFSYFKVLKNDRNYAYEYSILGSKDSGMNTFKGDSWWTNTGKNFKIKEKKRNTSQSGLWFYDKEQKYSTWFKKYIENPRKDGISIHFWDILQKNTSIYLEREKKDSRHTSEQCVHGLSKLLARMLLLQTIRLCPLSLYITFQVAPEGGKIEQVTFNQFKKNSWVVENAYGGQDVIAYSTDYKPIDDGSGWVLIPLLYNLQRIYNYSTLMSSFRTIYNEYFYRLIKAEYSCIHLPSAPCCHLKGINSSHTDDWKIAAKVLFADVVHVYSNLLNNIMSINKHMSDAVAPISIPIPYLNGSERYSKTVEYQGSPVPWKHSALQVGLLKMYSKEAPSPELIKKVVNLTTCFEVISLTDLTTEERCFTELKNTHEVRTSYESEGLRVFLTANWSIGVVLNLTAAYIGVTYLVKIFNVYLQTRFRDVVPAVALSMDIQGSIVLSNTQIALLSSSAIPLLIVLHLPADSTYVTGIDGISTPWLVEILVILGMSWFVCLGEAIGRMFISIKGYSYWLNIWVSRFRQVLLLLILLPRLAYPPIKDGDYHLALMKLFVSIVCSFALGFGIIMISKFFPVRKLDDSFSKTLDAIGVDRSEIGLVGHTDHGWCISGMMMEGWKFVKYKDAHALVRDGIYMNAVDGSLMNSTIDQSWVMSKEMKQNYNFNTLRS